MTAPEPQPVVRSDFAPALDFAFEVRAFLAPSVHIGHGAGETTTYVPVTGGTVEGPRLRGTVLPGDGVRSGSRSEWRLRSRRRGRAR